MTDPPHDELADAEDEAGWDIERDGRMADCATDDDTVSTERYEP